MSERMTRRLDTITAYVRWLALIGIPIVAFLTPLTQDASLFLFIVLHKKPHTIRADVLRTIVIPKALIATAERRQIA